MRKVIISVFLLAFSLSVNAEAPTCHTYSGGYYCKYSGPVKRIYINASSLILLYFEDALDVDEANSYGMGISKGSAAAFNVSDNPEFAKLFYSTALTAQATGRHVVIQMRGSTSGYPKFDRIWLAEQ